MHSLCHSLFLSCSLSLFSLSSWHRKLSHPQEQLGFGLVEMHSPKPTSRFLTCVAGPKLLEMLSCFFTSAFVESSNQQWSWDSMSSYSEQDEGIFTSVLTAMPNSKLILTRFYSCAFYHNYTLSSCHPFCYVSLVTQQLCVFLYLTFIFKFIHCANNRISSIYYHYIRPIKLS